MKTKSCRLPVSFIGLCSVIEACVWPQGFSLWQAHCWAHLFAASCVGNSADDSPATDSEWSHTEGRRAGRFRFQQEKPSLDGIRNYPLVQHHRWKQWLHTASNVWVSVRADRSGSCVVCCVVWGIAADDVPSSLSSYAGLIIPGSGWSLKFLVVVECCLASAGDSLSALRDLSSFHEGLFLFSASSLSRLNTGHLRKDSEKEEISDGNSAASWVGKRLLDKCGS